MQGGELRSAGMNAVAHSLAFALFRMHRLRTMKVPLLTISILIATSPVIADESDLAKRARGFLPLARALNAIMPPERNYQPGLRVSQAFEDRRWADPDYIWPVERIPLPPPSRELRQLLPLPGGRQVMDTTQK
jgi:hypothetical protein